MQIFYAPDIRGSTYILSKNESRHCIRVLRMNKGSPVKIIDGVGNLFEGHIVVPDPARCEVTITGISRNFEKRDYRLHIAISPLKNQDRFEWFVEKSVEIGIDEITPVICKNTEKPGLKEERINNIIISAMKQSLKAFRPVLNEPRVFNDFAAGEFTSVKMIAHCNPGYDRKKIDVIYQRNLDAVILIGPEGDFSEEEISLALKNGFEPVHLGNSRLRAETAGIAACHSVYFINQDH
jgi:16S rRNA (uracil1498-N3)-methyltransferase